MYNEIDYVGKIVSCCGGGETDMAEIKIRDNESLDNALRRFKDKCRKSGVINEAKKRRFYEKPSDARKRRAADAKKGR